MKLRWFYGLQDKSGSKSIIGRFFAHLLQNLLFENGNYKIYFSFYMLYCFSNSNKKVNLPEKKKIHKI